MTTDTELRWFWLGKLDPTVESWFRSAPELQGDALSDKDLDQREDFYVVDKDSIDFGLKLREKRIELKRLLGARDFRAHAGAEGIAQIWVKSTWTYLSDAAGPRKDPVIQAVLRGESKGDVVALKKRRWQRKYAPAEGGLKPVPSKSIIPVACNVELTALELNQTDWWTICFEAYGDIERPGTLADTVAWFFERFHGSKPKREQSESYPAWLARNA